MHYPKCKILSVPSSALHPLPWSLSQLRICLWTLRTLLWYLSKTCWKAAPWRRMVHLSRKHIHAEANSFRALFFRNIFGPATERVSNDNYASWHIFLCSINPDFECYYCTVHTRKPYEHAVLARQRLFNFTCTWSYALTIIMAQSSKS